MSAPSWPKRRRRAFARDKSRKNFIRKKFTVVAVRAMEKSLDATRATPNAVIARSIARSSRQQQKLARR